MEETSSQVVEYMLELLNLATTDESRDDLYDVVRRTVTKSVIGNISRLIDLIDSVDIPRSGEDVSECEHQSDDHEAGGAEQDDPGGAGGHVQRGRDSEASCGGSAEECLHRVHGELRLRDDRVELEIEIK